tara:strand:- start:3139 stop:4455 length:1317 start_codon:yes stop_codon:yes gene_type:complete
MLTELKNFNAKVKKINSWNLTYCQKVLVVYPLNLKELKDIVIILKKKKKTFIIKTGECSYDSKSILSDKDGVVVSLKNFNKIIKLNKKKEILSVESGAKISEVVYFLKKKNLTLYSIPGGEHVSIGGAISANVIGKDSSKLVASFGDSIRNLKIISYQGVVKRLKNNSKEFLTYIGSFGMSGIILEATIKTKKIVSNNLLVETKILKNIKEIESELKKKSEYKYIQVDPFFRKKNFAIAFNGNSIKNFENKYRKKNLKPNIFEVLLFKISSFFINSITWKIFYNLFFIINRNKKYLVDIHNFHYTSKYKHMIPLICKKGLIDYEISIQKNFNHLFIEIQKFLTDNQLAPIYIIVKKLFKSKKRFFYSFNSNAYAVAISFNLKDLNGIKKERFEKLLKKRKLLLNLSKTDSQYIAKKAKIDSPKNEIFMSLYKKMLISK